MKDILVELVLDGASREARFDSTPDWPKKKKRQRSLEVFTSAGFPIVVNFFRHYKAGSIFSSQRIASLSGRYSSATDDFVSEELWLSLSLFRLHLSI